MEIETSIDWRGEHSGVDVHPIPTVGVDLGVAHRAAPALEDLEIPGRSGEAGQAGQTCPHLAPNDTEEDWGAGQD